MTIQEESKLWRELAEIIIKNSNREVEEWLEQNQMLEEYKERVRECEQRQQTIANSETEKIL